MAARKKYPPGTKRVSYFMPPDLKAELEQRADAIGCSETEIVHDALRAELAKPAPEQEGTFG